MDHRLSLLNTWLTEHCGLEGSSMQPLAGDASFRRYFRVTHQNDTFVAMDAPPDKENCVAYIAIADALREQGLKTPVIFKQELKSGFLLISDFGDQQLLGALKPENAEQYYGKALDALTILQATWTVDGWEVPVFSSALMHQEFMLFEQWFLEAYLGLTLTPAVKKILRDTYDFLADHISAQPYVFMHRDYHSANLMVLPDSQIGILDFQDAFHGPVTYDLISLLRDCYIDWPDNLVTKCALRYKQQLEIAVSDELFLRWFDFMGLQRHMKALLTFSRKHERDHQSHYLKHIPRTLQYIVAESAQYPELSAFNTLLHEIILPSNQKVPTLCAQ